MKNGQVDEGEGFLWEFDCKAPELEVKDLNLLLFSCCFPSGWQSTDELQILLLIHACDMALTRHHFEVFEEQSPLTVILEEFDHGITHVTIDFCLNLPECFVEVDHVLVGQDLLAARLLLGWTLLNVELLQNLGPFGVQIRKPDLLLVVDHKSKESRKGVPVYSALEVQKP